MQPRCRLVVAQFARPSRGPARDPRGEAVARDVRIVDGAELQGLMHGSADQ